MKKNVLLIVLVLVQTICFGQKFDGDWKGKINDKASNFTKEFIFHIVGDNCSEELVRRSPAQMKEIPIEMSITDDCILLKTRSNGIFKGKRVKNQIEGTYEMGYHSYRLVLTKFGKGVIHNEDGRIIDKESGLIFYK